MQNIPLVYGESMQGSQNWMEFRSQIEAEQEGSGGLDENMGELE